MAPPKDDVRRLLKKQQSARAKTTRVSHPFAKYDDTNRLICIVCHSPVKSEAVWQAHLASTVHAENIQKLKALKEKQQQQQQQVKRRAASPPRDSDTSQHDNTQSKRVKFDIEISNSDNEEENDDDDEPMGLPADFFDGGEGEQEEIPEEMEEHVEEQQQSNTLPAGFFDNPEEDARIQGTLAPEEQAKLDMERDLEAFNEAMVDVTKEADQHQEEDDELFWTERHYDLNREQEALDSRVEKLKQMRQAGQVISLSKSAMEDDKEEEEDKIVIGLKSSVREVLKKKPIKKVESMFDDESESEEEEDDWRAQQL